MSFGDRASRERKFNSRGLDENGGISLGSADLARFGFGGVVQFDIAAE
jgi:hypothetical protein